MTLPSFAQVRALWGRTPRQRLDRRLLGLDPSALTVVVGQPLPPRDRPRPEPDFCNRCDLDVYGNPEVRVTGLDATDVIVVCDCGHESHLHRWQWP